MPVKYRFDSKIVIMEMVGEYSIDELRTTILNALADPERPASSFLLMNMTESKSIYNRSSDDVRAMANFVGSLGKRFNNRIAFVAPGDLPYGLARMGSAGAEDLGIEARVFRAFDEARKWLQQ